MLSAWQRRREEEKSKEKKSLRTDRIAGYVPSLRLFGTYSSSCAGSSKGVSTLGTRKSRAFSHCSFRLILTRSNSVETAMSDRGPTEISPFLDQPYPLTDRGKLPSLLPLRSPQLTPRARSLAKDLGPHL